MDVFNKEREQKFISIYNSFVDEIYKYIYLHTGLNKETAEDITEDVFVDVYKGIAKFKGLCSERTWIFKIAKNKLNDFYRKQYAPHFELIELDGDESQPLYDTSQNVEELLLQSFEREQVKACLCSLPEQYKIVLILKYIDDKSVKDIALIIQKSPKATESILQRAKNAFIKNYTRFDKKEG